MCGVGRPRRRSRRPSPANRRGSGIGVNAFDRRTGHHRGLVVAADTAESRDQERPQPLAAARPVAHRVDQPRGCARSRPERRARSRRAGMIDAARRRPRLAAPRRRSDQSAEPPPSCSSAKASRDELALRRAEFAGDADAAVVADHVGAVPAREPLQHRVEGVGRAAALVAHAATARINADAALVEQPIQQAFARQRGIDQREPRRSRHATGGPRSRPRPRQILGHPAFGRIAGMQVGLAAAILGWAGGIARSGRRRASAFRRRHDLADSKPHEGRDLLRAQEIVVGAAASNPGRRSQRCPGREPCRRRDRW